MCTTTFSLKVEFKLTDSWYLCRMIDLLKTRIEESQDIVLLGHRNPDGDCTGATLAMQQVLTAMGKRSQVILPNAIPDYLRWLQGANEILDYAKHPEEVKTALQKADLLMALDFNAFSRLDEMQEYLPTCPCVMVDHHPDPQIDSDLLFSDTSVSSTCELITSLLFQMGYEHYLDVHGAAALFTGILTDTGRFNHNSSNPQTYRIVADLLAYGVDKDAIIDRVFDSYTEKRMRLMGFALSERMEVFKSKNMAIISLSLSDKERFNFQQGDGEGLVNMPLSIKGIRCSVFMQEYEDRIRMSFRSKGDFAVNAIANEHFNGGGHRNAAGGTSFDSLTLTLAKVKDVFGLE